MLNEDLQQNLMNEVYDKWRTDECRNMIRMEVIEQFSPIYKVAVQLGNLNYQVDNGGFSQWHGNNYSEDLDDLIEICKMGVKLSLKTFTPLLQILIEINSLGDPEGYQYSEEQECCQCGGSGIMDDYDEDDNEIEVECTSCYGEGTYEEDVNGENAYCEELQKFDSLYYEIDEVELLKDFALLLENYDAIKDIETNDVNVKPLNKPRCKLIGKDGNVFSIIGSVCSALNNSGLREEAQDFQNKAMNSDSYDEVLCLCMDFVDVY